MDRTNLQHWALALLLIALFVPLLSATTAATETCLPTGKSAGHAASSSAGPRAIGDSLTAFRAPSDFPTGLAFLGGKLWVADWEESTLYEMDPSTGTVIRSVAAPCHKPEGLAADGEYLYVSGYETGAIYVFDPRTGLTVRSYSSPEHSPRDLAYGGGSLWLVDDGSDSIYELVPYDGTILNYYKAPFEKCRGLAHDGRYLWVTDRREDQLYCVRPEDGKVLFLVKTPGPFPIGLAFGATTTGASSLAHVSLWLADFQTKNILRLETHAGVPYSVSNEVTRDFRFKYEMRNDGDGVIKEAHIHVAVPYDSLENQVLVSDVVWQPKAPVFRQDRWGQDIAVFSYKDVERGETVEGGYSTRVRLGELHYAFYPEDVGGLDEIPRELLEMNTAATSRLQLDRDEIQSNAKQIVGDETNPYWIARGIFDWVNEQLEYQRVGGWDVPTTLIKRGTGSCSEYAFLYIALCRAAGLPARYEGSVVVRGDDASMDDVYHRWCEVYLPRIGWMPVDPSGGDREWPAEQVRYFGGLANRFIITTHGGGDSDYLHWSYNAYAEHVYEGRGTVHEEGYGIWSAVPADVE